MSVPSASPLNKRSHGRCILISVSVFVFLRSRKVTIFARFIVSVKKKRPLQSSMVRIQATVHH